MKVQVNRNDHWALAVILAATVLSRIPFRAQIPYGLDSIQFVLGTSHYDVRIHQPHPPGYFLFVMTGRFLSTFLQDPNLSFVALNVVLSMLAAWLVFSLAREMFGVRSAFASVLLMATSPVFWFHGEVALSNAADCFFVCLLALFCWRNLNHDYGRIYLSAVVLGLAGGIRQNTLLFMLPLWILSIRRVGLRKQSLSFAILVLIVTSWYLPMASLSGGIAAYQSALRDHWLNSNWHGFSLEWVPFNSFCVAYFILLGTGPGTLFLLLGALFYFDRVKLSSLSRDPRFQFFMAWLLPPFGFFVFIYSHPIQTGHSLIYLPALMILMPGCVQLSCEQMKRLFRPNEMRLVAGRATRQGGGDLTLLPIVGFPLSQVLLVILVACNLFMFLAMNTAVSQSAIRKYELQVTELVAEVESHWSPRQVVLISYDFMFLGFRDLMFHLPEYHTYQPKIYSLAGKDLLFTGFRRETRLVEQIEVPGEIQYFVLDADEFVRNPELIEGIRLDQYPKESFLITPSGSRLFRGEIQNLPKLFPRIHIKLQ